MARPLSCQATSDEEAKVMKELLEKISSYNLLNYLLPGVLFVVLADMWTGYSFVQEDVVLGVFLYYFIGMTISRVGSLVLEPVLKGLSFLRFADYEDFLNASKSDKKIELLSEVNNGFRTMAASLILLLILKMWERIQAISSTLQSVESTVLVIVLILLYLFAYRKQTSYLRKRVEGER